MAEKIKLISFLLLLSSLVLAQSSKTKAAEKLYEKGGTSGNVLVTNTSSINTEHLEFSPTFYQNGLVYTTAKRKSGPRDGNIDETFFELSFAELDGNGMPIEAEPFSVEMNSRVHEGPVTFSRDGRTIFFTRNNLVKGVTTSDSNGKIRLKVFQARKGFFDWEEVEELPFNSDEYDVMHPSLSPDGKWLYFASNMPGTFGGTDIWVVAKDGDNWGAPTNLGPSINSEKNDAFPFIHESGDLFFASNGKGGSGGYDIYKVKNAGRNGETASNVGAPFNSSADDFGLIMNALGTRGYFTSARRGGKGKDDIYKYEVTEGFLAGATPDIHSMIRVYDKETSGRIEGAAIRVFERSGEGILSGGDLYDVVLLPSSGNSNELVMKLVPKDASSMGEPDLMTDPQGEHPYAMRPDKQYVFFVSKEGYLTKELVYSTVGRSGDLVVEVPLEKKRCATLMGTVKDAQTGGILANTNVRISNTCTTAEEVVLSDGNGQFTACLPAGCNYTLSGNRTGYTNGTSSVTVPSGNLADMSTTINLSPNRVVTTTPPSPTYPSTSPSTPSYGGTVIRTGSSIVLDKIYYDFNKSAIRKGAAEELEGLASIMRQYPSMSIELISHTDSRGTSSYNMTLSRRRAESAKRYLMAKGISGDRINAQGYGESEPRNGCKDGVACSEEEHQYNRRTEVRVVRIDEGVQVQYDDNGPEVIDRKN